jgi:hypothetical protein
MADLIKLGLNIYEGRQEETRVKRRIQEKPPRKRMSGNLSTTIFRDIAN